MNQSRAVVFAAQVAVGAAFITAWQTLVSLKILDPFFVSRPSDIARRIGAWREDFRIRREMGDEDARRIDLPVIADVILRRL